MKAVLIGLLALGIVQSSVGSETQVARFKRLTGFPNGRPGWVVDHMVPLACGGPDHPLNMWWQPEEEAKAKDRVELDCTRLCPPYNKRVR